MIAWYFIVYFSSALKRFLDILGAGVGLITFFPVLVVVAFFIYAHDKGGVIFVQKRVGRWG
jgi:lipopolysaccharide/colanic/teichoic acid biosynthesis glycosyltransferase